MERFAGRLSRRQMLQGIGVAGATAVAGPALLAACGGDNKSSDSGSATTAGGGSATTAAPVGDVGKQLAEMLKVDASKAGSGQSWNLGAVLALSGNGSYYGKTMTRGIDLAVKHIAAAGGPSIKVQYKDHKSGDPAAGVNAVTELGTSKVPAKLASYGDDIGAMLEGTAQYKMFTFDPGGGTSVAFQKKPYFWGTRAITPFDALPGMFAWVKAAFPDAKTVGSAGWDGGEPANTIGKEAFLKAIAAGGYEFNGLYELFAPNTTDYASILPKIKDNEPDVLMLGAYGQDPGNFMNQSLASGIKSTIIGFEFTPDGLSASRGAYDKGWTFSYDYFDPGSAASPLGKLFVSSFKEEYGEDPDFYAANFYESTLGMWDVYRRVLAKGGNVNSGDDLNNAFMENTQLVSVYGGDASTNGTLKLDPTTHTVTQRTMGVFIYKDGKVTPQAFFDLNGANFKLVNQ